MKRHNNNNHGPLRLESPEYDKGGGCRHCEHPGCKKPTTYNKPFCREHIHMMTYVKKLLRKGIVPSGRPTPQYAVFYREKNSRWFRGDTNIQGPKSAIKYLYRDWLKVDDNLERRMRRIS